MNLKVYIGILLFAMFFSCGVDSQNHSTTPNKISFEFYSSHEKAIYLAYIKNLNEKWQYLKMNKNGNKFTADLKVNVPLWYEYVCDSNIWFKKDPLNANIDNDHPFLRSNNILKNRNDCAKYVSRDHFDFFTTRDTSDIKRLEYIYNRLKTHILSFLNEDLHPIQNKKIRYYSCIFNGMYTISGNGEIVDDSNELNSHEIIHALLYKYPKFAPFAEGFAQCFQERGNKRPLIEINVNMSAQNSVSKLDLYDVLKDWGNHRNYNIVASFIYYNIYIQKDPQKRFVKFIKSLTDQNMTFNEFENLFQYMMQKDLKTSIDEWRVWVMGIDSNSDIYVNWN